MKLVLRFLLHTVLPLAILGVAGFWGYEMLLSPPKAEKAPAPVVVPVVGVANLDPVDTPIFIEAYGTVVPAKKVIIQPEVGGRILDQHPDLIPGGVLREGEVLFRIDPSDYDIAVSKARAELIQASANCAMEQGQQVIAQREWKLLEGEIAQKQANPSLALRQPQLQRSEAACRVAASALDMAELELSRTVVPVPFDAMVMDEFTEIGQLVDRQTRIATLIGTEEFWVQASIPVDRLAHIQFPVSEVADGSKVRIVQEAGFGKQVVREGHVIRLLADLDPEGRMARVLVRVRDPLALNQAEGGKKEKILLGSYVQIDIEAGLLENVCVVPREAVRENSQAWVLSEEGTLQIRDLSILWRRAEDVLVDNRFEAGDLLITTRLSNAIPGMKLKPTQANDPRGIPGEIPVTALPEGGEGSEKTQG